MTNVTQTFLPPISQYQQILQRAWDKIWLTNRGELVLELETNIAQKLSSKKGIAMNNGTIPIQIALKLLGNGGEIITTPFSYVATTSSIVWEGCTPVFVDIQPNYWTIDPEKIEAAITEKTTCILATHVFGNPCDVIKINAIKNIGILMEEVGELSRLMVRKYGEQSFKESEKGNELGDEMADVLWVLICLANQTGVDLTEALQKNFEKKNIRDATRHQENQKLK